MPPTPDSDRTDAQPSCVIRGEHGGVHSLAHVNDGLGAALAGHGRPVLARPTRSARVALDCPTITHSWPPDFSPGSDGPTIAILPWEFGAPPLAWVRAAREQLDRVWVPSAFVRDGYVAGGMPPGIVDVVPNGVALERFAPGGEARAFAGPARACTFLFSGGTIWRKGIDVLLDAWARAFGPGDDVRLVVKDIGADSSYRGQTAGAAIRALAARDDVAPVLHVTDELAPHELPALYRAADVVVLPYRGEGFCLPALEAMACGVPVIHTGAGPTGEFCPQDAGWALPSRRVRFAARTQVGPTAGAASVLEVDPDALVAALRAAARDPAERAARGEAARRAAERMSWEHAGAVAAAHLDELATMAPPRWARAIAAPALETRGTTVLYAPDWAHPEGWGAALRAWAASFSAEDDVTLVVAAPAAERDALAPAVLACLEGAARADGELPDVLLDAVAPGRLDGLVAHCDAVLLDDAGHHPGATHELLTRRALRTLAATPAALAAFAAQLHAGHRLVVPAAA
jgi:glycosyltransferase involved in cell wall biosynthesis